jgi:VanZ family protein
MLPLAYRRYWQIAGLLLMLAVLVGAVMPAIWLWPDRARLAVWFADIDKWAHAFAFAVLALWFAGQYRPQSYWRIAIGLLAYGLLIELIQNSLSHRQAEFYDVVADVVGIAIGLTLALLGVGGWSLRVENWLAARRSA